MASAEKDGYEIPAEQKKALLEKRDAIVKSLEGNTEVNNNGDTIINNQGDSSVKSEGGVSQVNNNGGRATTKLFGDESPRDGRIRARSKYDEFVNGSMRSGTIKQARAEGTMNSIRMNNNGAALAGNIENINNVANNTSTNISSQSATTSSNVSTNTSNTSNTSSSSLGGVDKHKEDQLLKDVQTIIKEIKNSKKSESSLKSINSQIADADKEIANAKRDIGSAATAKLMGAANAAMGGAIGLGMGENLGDAIGKGGLATAAFDAASEKAGKNPRVGGTSTKTIEAIEDMKSKLLSEMSKTTRTAAKAMDRTANMNNL